jgi:hypothetical protein
MPFACIFFSNEWRDEQENYPLKRLPFSSDYLKSVHLHVWLPCKTLAALLVHVESGQTPVGLATVTAIDGTVVHLLFVVKPFLHGKEGHVTLITLVLFPTVALHVSMKAGVRGVRSPTVALVHHAFVHILNMQIPGPSRVEHSVALFAWVFLFRGRWSRWIN